MTASDYADWWDRQKQISEKALGDWVQDNPQWWVIGAATLVQTSMDLGAGMVDALRLGEGAADGGIGGFGKDALRLITLLGPLGKAGGMLSRFANLRAIRLAATTGEIDGPCTFTAVNNALSIISRSARNLFITARDAAEGLGKPLSSFSKDSAGLYKIGAWIDELVPFLENQGVRIKTFVAPQTVEGVAQIAKSENGVVIFSIKYRLATPFRSGGETIETIEHSVIAVRNSFGQVRYADYGGKLVKSLQELAGNLGYGAPDANGITLMRQAESGATLVKGFKFAGLMDRALSVMKGGVLVIEGMTAIETVERGVDLAIPVTVSAAPVADPFHTASPEIVKASFDAFKARKQNKPLSKLPTVRYRQAHRPPRSDWLTGVQYRLNAAGFGAGPVDGILGPRTLKAIHEFQRTYKLRVDGIPGPKTQAKLVELCGY